MRRANSPFFRVHLLLSFVCAGLFFGCAQSGTQNAGQQTSSENAGSITIVGNVVTIDGKALTFPIEQNAAFELLGTSDRVADLANRIHTWDNRGFYFYQRQSGTPFFNVVVALGKEDFEFSPARTHTGGVTIGDLTITTATRAGDLKAAGYEEGFGGFSKDESSGRYIGISMDESGRPTSVSVEWQVTKR